MGKNKNHKKRALKLSDFLLGRKKLAKAISEYQVEADSLESKQLRPMGCITLDMEKLLEEMTGDHDLQWGEVLGLVHTWLSVHAPQAQEEYVDRVCKHPTYYYGAIRK